MAYQMVQGMRTPHKKHRENQSFQSSQNFVYSNNTQQLDRTLQKTQSFSEV
jgi:hypothetical protein